MFRLVLSNINMKQKGDIHIKHGKLVGGGAANSSTNFLYLNTNMDNINQLGYPERCHNYWFFFGGCLPFSKHWGCLQFSNILFFTLICFWLHYLFEVVHFQKKIGCLLVFQKITKRNTSRTVLTQPFYIADIHPHNDMCPEMH